MVLRSFLVRSKYRGLGPTLAGAGIGGVRYLQTVIPVNIKELFSHPPQLNSLVTARGHIKSIRHFKKVGFIDLSDGSHYRNMNVVLSSPDSTLSALNLKVGQSVSVTGQWVESKGAQKYEISYSPDDPNQELRIIGNVTELYPIQKKSHTLQFLRNVPTLRHRTSTLASVLRLRSFAETKLIEFFNAHNFIKVSPPIITSSDCEGAGEQFVVESNKKSSLAGVHPSFFGGKTYLTVSTQLHLEVLAASLNRVWTLTPCFRAEDSNTNRHLSEFWMLEAEYCYVDKLSELTDFTEDLIRYVTTSLVDQNQNLVSGASLDLLAARYKKEDKAALQRRWETILVPHRWPSVTYENAIGIINEHKPRGKADKALEWGDDISTEQEKWIAGEHFKSPVFITDYPASQKPFYMKRSEKYDPAKPTVACYDLLLPEIGELVGGSLREHNYEQLAQNMDLLHMNKEDMDWYLSTRIEGSVPHGGFGLGFERLISFLSALENVKDTIPFPRVPESCPC